VYKHNLGPAVGSAAQWAVEEPLAVISAMAAATKNQGFGVTVATKYEPLDHLTLRFSTIDHLTKDPLGWNIVTGYLTAAACDLGLTELPEHDERSVISSIMYYDAS
jgi:alkanesulfonate monooxygenase SsuD/methylene tetrahydromethanopterin reductase-like flavin-dependent oxidoreductase (luciferase family)